MKELFRRLKVKRDTTFEYGLIAAVITFFIIWAWTFVDLLRVLLV
jgi:Flp pilus assembly pilin Flp